MKQKNADLLLLVQAGLLGISPLLAMLLLKTKRYDLYFQAQEFLFISKISLIDQYWVIALLISITAAAGISVYYQSGKTKRGALLCLSSFAFLKSLVFLPLLTESVFFTPNDVFGIKKRMTVLLVYYLLWFLASLLTLIWFTRKENKLLKINELPIPATPTGESVLEGTDLHTMELVVASKEKRFANYLADSFIIMLVAAPVLSFFLGFGNNNIYGSGNYKIIMLQTTLGTIAYYGLFETCFKSTPGKYLTGTRVIHQNGNPATILQTIGRTFCRIIPFDHFSFLGNRGWHDAITGTDVVETPQIKA